ncbi:hypothetical protein U9M48_013260 [Paspalum notatum var. saurae]|uniref:Uncharacterized protein n=1 Tax=Paspalum notatum var. saurae TaxID=547442 RepID=A0AAQ3SZN0_PASNO
MYPCETPALANMVVLGRDTLCSSSLRCDPFSTATMPLEAPATSLLVSLGRSPSMAPPPLLPSATDAHQVFDEFPQLGAAT